MTSFIKEERCSFVSNVKAVAHGLKGRIVADSGHLWLTGFGISSQLPRERQTPVPREILACTLAYMSREQAGRMNRSVDSRSDLHSLGVTLYLMLTGRFPSLPPTLQFRRTI
jgi:serine/threonine protein kinase